MSHWNGLNARKQSGKMYRTLAVSDSLQLHAGQETFPPKSGYFLKDIFSPVMTDWTFSASFLRTSREWAPCFGEITPWMAKSAKQTLVSLLDCGTIEYTESRIPQRASSVPGGTESNLENYWTRISCSVVLDSERCDGAGGPLLPPPRSRTRRARGS